MTRMHARTPKARSAIVLAVIIYFAVWIVGTLAMNYVSDSAGLAFEIAFVVIPLAVAFIFWPRRSQ